MQELQTDTCISILQTYRTSWGNITRVQTIKSNYTLLTFIVRPEIRSRFPRCKLYISVMPPLGPPTEPPTEPPTGMKPFNKGFVEIIGPKGFTGEKYGGSTYWDTEAYCIPFYMATKDQTVARNLLTYRYNHLQKAIENAEKLGFSNGAALYPMVTMNGEECHNEWEITFEEIHRNGAIAFAIYNYHRFTGDYSYIPEKGLEVLIGIARFFEYSIEQYLNNYNWDNKY